MASAASWDWMPSTFEWNSKTTWGSDPRVPIIGGMLYLLTIFSMKFIMRNRKAMDLKMVSAWHNGILAAFSLVVFVGQGYETYVESKNIGWMQVFCAPERARAKGRLYYWVYIFYLSKYYEFLDTILLVLKKKPLDFLHCYHHAIVPTGCWLGWNGWYMPLITACIFNSSVHTVMYYYYCLATLGIRPWWKKYVTVFQIVQFCSGAFFTVSFYLLYFKDLRITETNSSWNLSFTKGCSGEVPSVILVALINLSFLWLFVSFYAKAYKAPSSKVKAA